MCFARIIVMTTRGDVVITRMSVSDARQGLTKLPERFVENPDLTAVAVERHGKPVLAVLPWALYESLAETLEILVDDSAMSAFRQSIREADRGETSSLEDVKARLGL